MIIKKYWNKVIQFTDYDGDDFDTLFADTFEKLKTFEIIVNVVASFLSLIIFNLKLWQLPLVVIGVDILLTLIGTILVWCKSIKLGHTDVDEKLLNRIENLKKDYKECKKLIDGVCVRCKQDSGYLNSKSYYCKKKRNLEEEAVKLKEEIEKVRAELKNNIEGAGFKKPKEEIEQLDKVTNSLEFQALESYNIVLEDLKGYIEKGKLAPLYLEMLNTVYNYSNNLYEEVKLNSVTYSLVQMNYNVYIPEIIQTICKVNKVQDIQEKQEYEDKLDEMINEYIEYVIKQVDRVKKYNLQDIDISINTLIKDIKETKETF